MKHPLDDPNNHAPAAAPDAGWEDSEEDYAVVPRFMLGFEDPPPAVAEDGGVGKVPVRGVIEPRPFRQRAVREDPVVRIEPVVRLAEEAGPRDFEVNRIGEVVRLGATVEDVVPLEAETEVEGFLPARTAPKFAPAGPAEQAARERVGREWGHAGRHSKGWMFLAVLGVLGVLVGGLVLHSNLVGRDEAGRDGVQLALEPVVAVAREEMFDYDLTAEVEARRVLAAVAVARELDEVLPWVRGGEVLRAKIAERWRPWTARAGWQPDSGCSWEVNDEGVRGFGILSGFRPDFEPFRAYFVREGGRLVLDWEATEAVSDEPFERLAQGEGAGGLVRVWARRGDFYTIDTPEAEFRSVQLLSPDQDWILWGYARRGSEADRALGKFFDDGLILEAEATILPLTLRLAPAAQHSLPNQWGISEVLHAEWVQP